MDSCTRHMNAAVSPCYTQHCDATAQLVCGEGCPRLAPCTQGSGKPLLSGVKLSRLLWDVSREEQSVAQGTQPPPRALVWVGPGGESGLERLPPAPWGLGFCSSPHIYLCVNSPAQSLLSSASAFPFLFTWLQRGPLKSQEGPSGWALGRGLPRCFAAARMQLRLLHTERGPTYSPATAALALASKSNAIRTV